MGSFLSRLFPLMLMFNLYFFRNNKYMIYIVSIIFILVDILIFLSGERAAFFYLILSTVLILLMLDKYRLLRLFTFLISIVLITFISLSDVKVKDRMLNQTIKDLVVILKSKLKKIKLLSKKIKLLTISSKVLMNHNFLLINIMLFLSIQPYIVLQSKYLLIIT